MASRVDGLLLSPAECGLLWPLLAAEYGRRREVGVVVPLAVRELLSHVRACSAEGLVPQPIPPSGMVLAEPAVPGASSSLAPTERLGVKWVTQRDAAASLGCTPRWVRELAGRLSWPIAGVAGRPAYSARDVEAMRALMRGGA